MTMKKVYKDGFDVNGTKYLSTILKAVRKSI